MYFDLYYHLLDARNRRRKNGEAGLAQKNEPYVDKRQIVSLAMMKNVSSL